MNLNQAKTFLVERGYLISPRFKTKTTNRYWLYEVTDPSGSKKSYKARDIELLARRVSREA